MVEQDNVLFPKVAVLMSTYNGEKYLHEQIESILRQACCEVELFVRDDGSKDNTIKILENFKRDYGIHIYLGDENVGPAVSFMKLLYMVADNGDFDYFAFADQDDVWLPEKLNSAITKMKNDGLPTLYGSNQYLYINNTKTELRFKEEIRPTLLSVMNREYISGCTFVMDKDLAHIIISAPMPSKTILCNRMHDTWCMLVALIVGNVIYDDNAYILYRIHEQNAVGLKEKTFIDYVNKLRGKGERGTSRRNLRSVIARALLEGYKPINSRDKDILEELAYYRNSRSIKNRLLQDAEVMSYMDTNHLGSIIRVLFNLI